MSAAVATGWDQLSESIDASGWAVRSQLLTADECRTVAAYFEQKDRFRSRVIMARHGFGRGEYRYFRYPLPPLVQRLRDEIYPHLAQTANRWYERMGHETRFPLSHGEFLERCHRGGQSLPTPLLLKYGPGDYNCLHQDRYGEHVFPLQVAVLLSQPQQDFSGGEFVLTEQRPRMQSRASVVPLTRGDAVVFGVHQRPVRGTRGEYRVTQRHGVSTLHAGNRYALGIIFHDAPDTA